MKWYSLKKYIPPTNTNLVIRCINEEYQYQELLIARIEFIDNMNLIKSWEFSGCDELNMDEEKYIVTHFAIPNPIEIE